MSDPVTKAPTLNVVPTQTPAKAEAPQATPSQIQAEVRKMKLKFDGVESEMSESEVIALAQKGKTADKRFQEASQIRKDAEAKAKYLQENPREALKQLGVDVRKFSEDFLTELIAEQTMSPEQKKSRDMEAKLRGYETAEKQAKDKAEADELKQSEDRHLKSYDEMFVKALQESGLPKTQFTVKRMAELQLLSLRKNLDLDASQLAKLVREDYMAEQKALYASTDGNQLMELLGPEIVKKLSKAQVAKLKAAQPTYSKAVPKSDESRIAPKTNALTDLKNKNRFRR